MRRLLRALLVLTAAAAVALFTIAWVEQSSLHKVNLNGFDARAVGQLDTDMWRSYYERRPARLFRQMTTLLDTQFHMPLLMRVRNAYRAAHAAFVFKDGHNRAEYEKALPDLERYYADIAALAIRPFDPQKAARLELEWWILHRERSPQLAAALADLQAVIYGVPADRLADHAELRAEAMVLRDHKGDSITEADWKQIGGMLDHSWTSLYEAVNAPVSAQAY
jgi:hypothetical protein